MKKVNLRDLYPDIYKTDHFVEVTEDVLEAIRDAERAEAAYDRRMYRYKAYYLSLIHIWQPEQREPDCLTVHNALDLPRCV